MTDTKTQELVVPGSRPIPPGERIHDMWVRLVVDADLTVLDIMAVTDAAPFAVCDEAPRTLQTLKGERIGPGWSKLVRERLGGRHGCTHLRELLQPLATVAFQSLYEVRKNRPDAVDASGKPRKIDSCHAYAADGELVRNRWPTFSESPASTAIFLADSNK